ncbi:hypothetical protein BKG80_00110 [Mycobacteroides chelonae]|uniref:hypothetical protein n=1 Tax=Mycobacteroides chelonae TaxID=1774 RepID=UPI0008A8DABB|nr:hypothetical protein [Mycobacteroides chelonae]MBF9352763.1 hypothetical protein [Mycobacteroides chelonae]OHU44777.1 hypothetical protein BKG80_00110 [Mycobacteroides chelonae]
MDLLEITRATFVDALAATPVTRPPAAELTAGDARLLEKEGLSQCHADAWGADAEITARIKHLVTAALTADEVANGLGITTTEVHEKQLARRLWAITDGRLWIFPAPQFEIGNDGHHLRVIRGIDQVVKSLPEDLHPIAVEGFLSTPQPDLLTDRPTTPLEWLLGGGDISTVLAVASAAYR